ncbi:MAG: hypothetical protein RL685_6178 [Pseudomonadota bacterium]
MIQNKDPKGTEPAELSNDELAEITGGLVRTVPLPIDPGLFSSFDFAGLGSFTRPEIRPLSPLLHKDNDPPPPPPPPPVSVGSTGPGFGVRIGGTF